MALWCASSTPGTGRSRLFHDIPIQCSPTDNKNKNEYVLVDSKSSNVSDDEDRISHTGSTYQNIKEYLDLSFYVLKNSFGIFNINGRNNSR